MAKIKNITSTLVPLPEFNTTLAPGEILEIDDYVYQRAIRLPRFISQKTIQVIVPPRPLGFEGFGRGTTTVVKEKTVEQKGPSMEEITQLATTMAKEMAAEILKQLPYGGVSRRPDDMVSGGTNGIQLEDTVAYLPVAEKIEKNFGQLEATKVDTDSSVNSAAEALRKMKRGK